MTDRISYLTVVLTHDIRADEVEAVMEAIRQNRHVLAVAAGEPVSPMEYVARERVKSELLEKVLGFLRE